MAVKNNACSGLWRIAELVLLFGLIPLLLAVKVMRIPKFLPLFLVTVMALVYIKKRRNFFSVNLWGIKGIKDFFPMVLLRLLPVCLITGGLVLLINPAGFLYFPRKHFLIWLLVMFAYPIFSALPQEIIYRGFFFHRYRKIFSSSSAMVAVSAVFFAFLHVVYLNWLAPLLTLPAGILFGLTYRKHESLVLCALEHGLYGAVIFTAGLGHYFFSGSGLM